MKKEDIHLYDWQRILQGPVPLEFYIELIIRGLFVYALITFGMKYMGKRISAELTRSELAAIASLAAATGLVIMAPDRGLLPPVIVLIVMLSIKWLIDKKNYRSLKFERFTEGMYSILVKDGVLQMHEMKETRMSREQIFAQLREGGITNLGMVKRLFIEANGSFSLVKEKEGRPGLPVLPPWDTAFLDELKRSEEVKICSHCGNIKKEKEVTCTECHSTAWEHPVNN
jgi:uncharacterized membrane protein YcaP (DUF421 family)